MKLLNLIIRVITTTYFSSADPNLFGSIARRKAKQSIADEYKAMATGSQDQIDQINSENPFESAGAKAAMARASQGAKAMETRMLNTMGAGASPEAIVSAQGATNEALGNAAGNIAAGAEATRANRVDNLNRLKTQQMGMYGQQTGAAEDERGSWVTPLGQFMSILGTGAGALGQGMSALSKKGDSSGGSSAGTVATVAKAVGSDIRLKDNIKKIGEIQGHTIYKFNYKGDPKTVIGVIAQELENTDSSNCIISIGEFMYVDYDQLFKEV